MAKLTGKKPVNIENVEIGLIDENDISLALNGSDEEKPNLFKILRIGTSKTHD
jgi:hypothetical protein